MKIVLAAPLYPPDMAESAVYIKELAKRLSHKHTVTIVTYGCFPEQIPGVTIIFVDKRRPLLLRLSLYTLKLWQAVRDANIIYAENGPSIELPLSLIVRALPVPLIFHIGDRGAAQHAKNSLILLRIQKFAQSAAVQVITDMPPTRPEILPFAPFPEAALEAYEKTWEAHTRSVETTFIHHART